MARVLIPLPRTDFDPTEAAVADYRRLQNSPEFKNPLRWDDVDHATFDVLLLSGGHASGVRDYLESPGLRSITERFFATDRPVGAICHGTVLVARSTCDSGRSVLHGRRTTGLTRSMELLAWRLTRRRLGAYYPRRPPKLPHPWPPQTPPP
jgi:putative intracellular protease/amidase